MASEYIYGGQAYSTDPKYNFNPYGNATGAYMPFGKLGSAIDPFVANQLNEASQQLNTGIKTIEIGVIKPETFGAIPLEHFNEIRRAARIAGTDISFHAPMLDPTGITQQGWTKLHQQSSEKQLWDAIEKSALLSYDPKNPKSTDKPTVVTIHATAEFPAAAETKIYDPKTKTERTIAMTVVDSTSGKVGQIGEQEEKYFPTKAGDEKYIGGKEPIPFNAQNEIDRINNESWMQRLSNLTYYTERGEQEIDKAESEKKRIDQINEELKKVVNAADKQNLENQKRDHEKRLTHGIVFYREVYKNLRELYDDAYKNANEEDRKKLAGFAKGIHPYIVKIDDITKGKDPEEIRKFAEQLEAGVKVMNEIHPKTYVPIRDFAIEKSAETTANLALRAYQKFGDKAPIIALENHPSNQALLTSGEDLRDVIKKARSEFVKKAQAEGISSSEAESQAKKLIGATWDVGHINQIRMFGYGEDELLKQTEAIKPFVKKVHLSDNFGMQNTELPMGMGNVPIKAIMEKLGQEGYDAKKIIEAGNWWTEFSRGTKANNPLIPTLAGMGMPIYSGGYGPSGGPGVNWNQIYGTPGGYFAGYGTMLPDSHFQSYGAGFTSLPTELGGQMAGKDSRFSGTPMA